MTLLAKRTRKQQITEELELLKNAKLRVTNAAGQTVEIDTTTLSGLAALSDELAILDGLTASAAELNNAADLSTKYNTLTENTTLTAADAGKVYFLNAAAGFDVTLPAPANGLNYRFIIQTAPTSNGYDIATNGGADIMKGMVTEANSATGAVDQNADNLNFAANVALAGDWVEVESDGTSWFFRGQVQANGGVVASTT